MFYAERHSEVLRLGDVVRGFPLSSTVATPAEGGLAPAEYRIEMQIPKFSVILSPCCSIGSYGNSILLCPLSSVQKPWFRNPFFRDDFTNVNRLVPPEKSVPPKKFVTMTPDEKLKHLASGEGFTLLEYFVYAPHDLLERYAIGVPGEGKEEVGHYAVDFRQMVRVSCRVITNPQVPNDETISRAKLLELSIEARRELREKLAHYFGKPADEDKIDV